MNEFIVRVVPNCKDFLPGISLICVSSCEWSQPIISSIMSANVSMESGSSSQQQQQQQQPVSLTKDDTTSSYATVVLSLKSQPRDQEKNDNNKENIGKDVNNIDASNKQNDVLATVQPNQQQQPQPQPSTTSSDDVAQGSFNDDELFTPVVSNNRKERRNGRKDKPKTRQLSGSSKPRDRGRTSKSENREKRDNRKDGRDRTENGKDTATKTETQLETTTPKSGNEEEADAEPVKFVEAPIPKVNAWKVSKISKFLLFCYPMTHIKKTHLTLRYQ